MQRDFRQIYRLLMYYSTIKDYFWKNNKDIFMFIQSKLFANSSKNANFWFEQKFSFVYILL